MLKEYKDCKMIIAGDGRCDSPGNSAKFCSYSMMDISTSKVLHVETIDKREVQLQSSNMEMEGVKRALDFLLTKLDKSVQIEEIITDASSSVRTTLGKHILSLMHTTLYTQGCLKSSP